MKKIALVAIILVLFSIKHAWADKNFDNVVHIEDEEMKILIGLNKTYKPGDSIRVDFFITNKKREVVNEVDIKLDVYYLGKKVFTYSHPSWREFRQNKEVHIYYETNLPAITLPGTYIFKFYFSPEGQKPKSGEAVIEVVPTEGWYTTVGLISLAVFVILLLITVHREKIKRYYFSLSIGQRFVLLAIIFLICAAIVLAGGAESIANKLAIITYFCLVVGVVNLLLEEKDVAKKIEDRAREGVGFLTISILMYLSEELPTIATLPFTVTGVALILRKYILMQLELMKNYYSGLFVFQRLALIASFFLSLSALTLVIGYGGIANKLLIIVYTVLIISIANLIYERRSNINEKDRETASIVFIGVLSYCVGGELSLWIPTIFAIIGVKLLLRK